MAEGIVQRAKALMPVPPDPPRTTTRPRALAKVSCALASRSIACVRPYHSRMSRSACATSRASSAVSWPPRVLRALILFICCV